MPDSVTLDGLITKMESSRRLAAIMFTDIVGYTALMGRILPRSPVDKLGRADPLNPYLLWAD